MVVIIDFGQTVRIFGNEAAARTYFNNVAQKRRNVWLISRAEAKRCEFI
jgi:hypothetical protein